jgi:hypothetical protein
MEEAIGRMMARRDVERQDHALWCRLQNVDSKMIWQAAYLSLHELFSTSHFLKMACQDNHRNANHNRWWKSRI